MSRTIPELAREAVAIQDASNLRGVLLAWHKAICEPDVTRGGQIEEFLNLLYLGKVCSLMEADGTSLGDATKYGTSGASKVEWAQAYQWAQNIGREG